MDEEINQMIIFDKCDWGYKIRVLWISLFEVKNNTKKLTYAFIEKNFSISAYQSCSNSSP